ncbi:MAG: aldose epimerase [Deltaproteobacteria bacterium]|nr:aldose epimerase [Deltaproteobacteria bacterium]
MTRAARVSAVNPICYRAMSVVAPSRYAVVETKDLVETHHLLDHERNAEVVVAPVRGGMVTRFRVGDDDILFLDHATLRDHSQNVRGGIPVLFPIAGRLTNDRFSLDGESVSLGQHGFARNLPWRITYTDGTQAAAITLSVEHSESTLAVWPFRFRLTFRYELRDGALTIQQKYENLDERPMPIHPGLHPYFRVEDWRKREARVNTPATRVFDNRTGTQAALNAPIDLGSGEVDLQLLDHGGTSIRLDRPDALAVELTYDDPATVIAVWTLPSRGFVCIEPWVRQADALNRGDAVVVPVDGAHQAMLKISPGI